MGTRCVFDILSLSFPVRVSSSWLQRHTHSKLTTEQHDAALAWATRKGRGWGRNSVWQGADSRGSSGLTTRHRQSDGNVCKTNQATASDIINKIKVQHTATFLHNARVAKALLLWITVLLAEKPWSFQNLFGCGKLLYRPKINALALKLS